MKKREFTKKDFKLMLLIATSFTVLYFIDLSIVAFQDIVEWSDTVSILSWLGFPTLKIIVILCWYMCMERYFFVEYQSVEKQENKRAWIPIAISIVIVVIMGWYIFWLTFGLVAYIATYWEYIEKLYGCVVIQMIIPLLWVLFWTYCIKKRKTIGGQQGIRIRKVVIWVMTLIALYLVTTNSFTYVEKQTDKARIEWISENWK